MAKTSVNIAVKLDVKIFITSKFTSILQCLLDDNIRLNIDQNEKCLSQKK